MAGSEPDLICGLYVANLWLRLLLLKVWVCGPAVCVIRKLVRNAEPQTSPQTNPIGIRILIRSPGDAH